MMPHPILVAALLAAAVTSFSDFSDDTWPGLWGPERNGVAATADAARRLEVLWRAPVEGGYSEVAVAGDLAVTMELHAGDDFVVARDAATGRERWRARVGATYKGHGGSDDGPISTPAIAGSDVFALGPHGVLIALDAASGAERWRHDLVRAFGATPPAWGFGASPLVEGRLVVVPTQGGRGLLAFDRATGALVWNAAESRATAYASAVAATIGGVRQILAASGDIIFAVAPEDGRVLWRANGPGGQAEVANSPIVLPGDRVLVTTWEQAVMLRVTRRDGAFGAEEVWRSPRLRGANAPVVYRDGHLYGFSGAQLICMNADTGEVVWRERTGAGTLIAVGNHLLVLGDGTGDLRAVPITTQGFTAARTTRVLDEGARAVTGPSHAGGRVFVRNLREIVALGFR